MSDVDLHVAVMVGARRDVNEYINAGGDLEVRDDEGATALFHAAFWTHLDVAKDLVHAGADVNAQRNDGATPIHVAAKNNQPRMTEVLVGARANLSVQEEFGDTPLHWAYRSKASECIEILLAAGADPEVYNHMGKTPRECEGTGVDRQDEEINDGHDEDEGHHALDMSDEPSAGDASTLVGDPESQGKCSRKSPNRPSDGRSTAASMSPRTSRNHSAKTGAGCGPRDTRRAHFRVSYPPKINGGGKWHSMTAYMFEPSAHDVVRQAHQARLSGDHQPFVASNYVAEDSDPNLPPGTEVVVRPRFPRNFCINPVHATVAWMREANAVSFEVRSPPSASSGAVVGCVDFYLGAVLIGQAHVEMNVVRSNASAKEPDILGPVAKMFDAVYVCFAPFDAPLLLPSLERLRRLDIVKLSWPTIDGSERETKDCIREASMFQVYWSAAAQKDGRVKSELNYAASLAKNGALAVRGIYWDPSMNPSSIETDQGIVFPVRLHNSFLLEDPSIIIALMQNKTSSSLAYDSRTMPKSQGEARNNENYLDYESGARDGAAGRERMAQENTERFVEKLCTTAVISTRSHVTMLRQLVGDASVVDLPRLVWMFPDDGGKPGGVDLEDASWLSKPIIIGFLCPISMKAGRCGEDGWGYRMVLPRGWVSKIGIALKIGAVIVAAAIDAGKIDELPIPMPPKTDAGGAGKDEGSMSLEEWRGKVVDAVYDGLASTVNAKTNEMVDSAFMEFHTNEGGSSPPPAAQFCKDTKHSYANLRSLIHRHDKGFERTGLVRVSHEDTTNVEWVHPSVAHLFRRQGPAIFHIKALEAADAEAATRNATTRERARGFHDSALTCRDIRQEGGRLDGMNVMSTLRLLEDQIVAMMDGGGATAA